MTTISGLDLSVGTGRSRVGYNELGYINMSQVYNYKSRINIL